MDTIGDAQGATPLIAFARDAQGEPIALLPLARRRVGPLRIASFQGGRMANYQMGLFREPERWTRADLERLLRNVARLAGVDLFVFAQQPMVWRDRANPMRELGGAASPSFAHMSRLDGDYARWLAAHYSADARKKRRAKSRKLAAFGEIALRRAHSPQERRAALETLLAQKRSHLTSLRLPNDFDDRRRRGVPAAIGRR